MEQAVVGIVEQFALLLFLDAFNKQTQLLANLIVGAAEQIGDARVHVEHGIDAAQAILARLLLILNEGRSEGRLIFVAAC